MPRQYRPFIDWMKFVGIFLIVCGHVAARPINHLTPPIYPKQLGVAFFIFVLGFSLANEKRGRSEVLFNRLFDMYVFAFPLALLISALAPIRHTLNLSNYLPFFLGANVVFDNFPANPTTWYVGTYLHILIVWALLVRFSVQGWILAVSLLLEIAIRYGLAASAGEYVAYMSLFNWSTVFLLGVWYGQRTHAIDTTTGGPSRSRAWLMPLPVVGVAWAVWMPSYVQVWSFPFAALSGGALTTAACVSVLYLTYTFLCFHAARQLPAPAIVRFFARNTLFVFLAHMPVFSLLGWLMEPYGLDYTWMAVINLAVCFVGLALVSEQINRRLAPRALRTRIATRLFQTPRMPAPAPGMSV